LSEVGVLPWNIRAHRLWRLPLLLSAWQFKKVVAAAAAMPTGFFFFFFWNLRLRRRAAWPFEPAHLDPAAQNALADNDDDGFLRGHLSSAALALSKNLA
jgi:hypothetical protein